MTQSTVYRNRNKNFTKQAGCQWLTSVKLAPWEAEIRRIKV
jgi:hypothetical protein